MRKHKELLDEIGKLTKEKKKIDSLDRSSRFFFDKTENEIKKGGTFDKGYRIISIASQRGDGYIIGDFEATNIANLITEFYQCKLLSVSKQLDRLDLGDYIKGYTFTFFKE